MDHSNCTHSGTKAATRACELVTNLPPEVEAAHQRRMAEQREIFAECDDLLSEIVNSLRPARWEI